MKILIDGPDCEFRASIRIGMGNLILPISFNRNLGISQNGGELQFFMFVVHRKNHQRIGTALICIFAGIQTKQRYIFNAAVGEDISRNSQFILVNSLDSQAVQKITEYVPRTKTNQYQKNTKHRQSGSSSFFLSFPGPLGRRTMPPAAGRGTGNIFKIPSISRRVAASARRFLIVIIIVQWFPPGPPLVLGRPAM